VLRKLRRQNGRQGISGTRASGPHQAEASRATRSGMERMTNTGLPGDRRTDSAKPGPLPGSLRKSSLRVGHWLGVDYKDNTPTDTASNPLGYLRWIAAMSMIRGTW